MVVYLKLLVLFDRRSQEERMNGEFEAKNCDEDQKPAPKGVAFEDFAATDGSGNSTNSIRAFPAAWSVRTIAFITRLPFCSLAHTYLMNLEISFKKKPGSTALKCLLFIYKSRVLPV
jgi:hypothetical protein